MPTNEESEREIRLVSRLVSLRFKTATPWKRVRAVSPRKTHRRTWHITFSLATNPKSLSVPKRMPRTRRKFLRRRIVFGKIRAVFFELYNAIAEKNDQSYEKSFYTANL